MLTFVLFCVYLPLAKTRPIVSQPDYELYHTKDSLLSSLHEVVDGYPAVMKFEERVKEQEGYSVRMPVITIEPGGFTSNHTNKLKIMMSFGEHGREIVTTEFALRLVKSLGDDQELVQYCPEGCSRLKEVLSQTVWTIIPIENPNGRGLFEEGKLCERKNGRGVDINRNWDIDFGIKEEDYDPSEEFPGKHAFSEPETQILKELSLEFGQHVWIGVHSGMCAMFMPYDHIGELPNGTSAEAQLKIIESVKTANLQESCEFGPGGKTVGYLAHGTATDYIYSVLKVPLAFTWEIYGDSSADYSDCYKMFNPPTKPVLEETLSRWMKATFHLVRLLPDHPDVKLGHPSPHVHEFPDPIDLIRAQTKFQRSFNSSAFYDSSPIVERSGENLRLDLAAICIIVFGLSLSLYLLLAKRRSSSNSKHARLDR